MSESFHNARRALPDIADAIRTQLKELARAPCACKIDAALATLDGARAHLVRLKSELLRQPR